METTSQNLTRPPFVADQSSLDRNGGRQVDFDALPDSYRVGGAAYTVTVGAAGAAAGATSVPVAALPVALPANTVLDFGGAKFARLSAAAPAGAVTLTTAALPTALVSGDAAQYGAGGTGIKTVPGGTVMVTLANGKGFPRAIRPNAETATHVLETEANEGSVHALTGFGALKGGVLYENMMPDAVAGSLPSAYKTELAAAGTGFAWEQAENSLWAQAQ